MKEMQNLLPVSDTQWRVTCKGCHWSRHFKYGQHAAYRAARTHWQKYPHHVVDVIGETVMFTYRQPETQMTLDDVPPF